MNDWVLDFLYPQKCIVCHRLLKDAGSEKLCVPCRGRIVPVCEPRCRRCSKAIEDLEAELCDNCRTHTFCVERGFALYPYDQWMRKAIQNIKYHGELYGGLFFADQIAERYGAWVRKLSPDVIIPVPLHKKRMRFRGFNQAVCLAGRIGEKLGIAVDAEYLIRTENTRPQKGLGSRARINNLQKGFAIREGRAMNYRCVLLVDDIYTTGATLEACARVLKRAGTRHVYFLCLCIGKGDS